MEPDLGTLFRRESGRLTAALARRLGPNHLGLVEDVVHDALVRALEAWKYGGVPADPSAWLITTAKNRAMDLLRRDKTARELLPELEHALTAFAGSGAEEGSDEAVRDDELRMMFACCHARLPEETQVVLILNLLGGFGTKEIAAAFLVGDAAMEKRVQRGKEVLGQSKGLLEVTAERVKEHLEAVHKAVYLLFNEGYHGNHPSEAIRIELCAEAIRLGTLLADAPLTALPSTRALLALMCLTAARLPGRADESGELLHLEAQDRSLWDPELTARGIAALEASASGDELTAFHVEAAIAYEHTTARTAQATNWKRIVSLYDTLLRLRPSPVVALSRAIAVGELDGPDRALALLDGIDGKERLRAYPFYAAAIADQHLRAGRKGPARSAYDEALKVARNPLEVRYLERRRAACDARS